MAGQPDDLYPDPVVRKGLIDWQGGKPKGLRGVVVRGEPVSETIIRDRR